MRTQQVQTGFGSLLVLPVLLFITRAFVPWFHRKVSNKPIGTFTRRLLDVFTWVFVLALGVGGIVQIVIGVFGLAPR